MGGGGGSDVGEGVLAAKTRVLVGAQAVVGKQMQLTHTGEGLGKPRDGGDLGGGIVEAGNDGHADDQVTVMLGDVAGVVQDLLVGLTRVGLVLHRIHVLDVHHDVVDVGDQAGDHFAIREGCRLNGGVEAVVVAGAEDGLGEIGLSHSLAARQGHAAARTTVVHLVLGDLFHQLTNRDVLTYGLGHAVHGQLLEAILLGLGIAAPAAPQVAPLQKHDGPNARAVMNREALNIKNPTGLVVVVCHVSVLSLGSAWGSAPNPAKTLFAKRVLESQKPLKKVFSRGERICRNRIYKCFEGFEGIQGELFQKFPLAFSRSQRPDCSVRLMMSSCRERERVVKRAE